MLAFEAELQVDVLGSLLILLETEHVHISRKMVSRSSALSNDIVMFQDMASFSARVCVCTHM